MDSHDGLLKVRAQASIGAEVPYSPARVKDPDSAAYHRPKADTGCGIWARCLECPLPKCVHEYTASERPVRLRAGQTHPVHCLPASPPGRRAQTLRCHCRGGG